MSLRIPPPILAAAAGLLQHLLAGRRAPTILSGIAATGLGAISAWLGLGALNAFRNHGTTIDPVEVDRASTLVESGPNAVTRNPMYLGIAVALCAYAAFRRSLAALLPVAGFVAVIDRCQIPAEERALEQKFGSDYREYRMRVPRWVRLPRQ